tara:strand:+ start:55 stop:459 length:405 start_codon:yes stop_codon:yes gene_type:complete
MAHFAELNDDNMVMRVIVVGNADTTDADGIEDESIGIAFCQKLLGGTWRQTSYNTQFGEHKLGGTAFRKNYCGEGFEYDEERDAFIPPKQFESWVLDEETCHWEAPVPMPDDAGPEKRYTWNEADQQWDEYEMP